MTEVTEVTEPGVYDGMPEDTYHADPVPWGSLSVSGAKRLLPPSTPALFKWEREHGRPDKRVFDFGHAAHAQVLGVGLDIVIVQVTAKDGTKTDAADYRTKSAQEHAKEIREAGKVPLLAAELEQVKAMAAAIRAHPVAAALFHPDHGKPEQSLFWIDEPTGTMLRGRLDWLPAANGDRLIIPDYKTADCANPTEFERSFARYRYHQQAPFYIDGVLDLGLAADAEFVFVVQEKTPPYLVSVLQPDVVSMRLGRAMNRRAIDIYAQCVANDQWPGYGDEVALVSVPGWFARQHEEDL